MVDHVNIYGDGGGEGSGFGSGDSSGLTRIRKRFNKNKENIMTTKCPYEGKYVIVRAEGPGVHFGVLKEYDSVLKVAYLEKARHLWYWTGFTLYAVANDGMSNDNAKISQECLEAMINNVLTLIPCTEKSIKNISEYQPHLGK